MSLIKSTVCPFERQQICCKICDGTSGAMESIFCSASDHRLLDKIFKCTRVRVVPVCGIISPVCEFCHDRINQFDESFKPVLSEYVVEKASSRNVAPDADPFGCLDPMEVQAEEEDEDEKVAEVREVKVPAILNEIKVEESVLQEVAEIKQELRDLLETVKDFDEEEDDQVEDDRLDDQQDDGKEHSESEEKPKPRRKTLPKKLSKCEICDKEVAYMKDHMRIHKEEKKFRCPQPHCDRSFSQSSNLIYHVRKHTGEKPFVCTYTNCDKAFICKAHLLSHERFHIDDKPYQCEFCSKRFNQACNLTKHRRVHTGVKPYCCSVCGRSFMNLSNMKSHEKRHRGDLRDHCCQLCPKRFYDNHHLERHLRVHSKPAKISCSVCSKQFTSEKAAKSHELKHAESLTCKLCSATFDDAQALKNHQKNHRRRPEKPVPCPDCSKSFSQEHLLERHIRRVHVKKMEVPEPDLTVSEEVEIITGDNCLAQENIESVGGKLASSSDVVPDAGQVVVKFEVR